VTIRIAVSGTEFGEADGVDGLIAAARGASVRAVELWFPKNYLKDKVTGTMAKIREAGLSVACISTPTSLYGSDRQKSLALLDTALGMAAASGATRVNTYFGQAAEVDDDRAIAMYAEAVSPLVAQAEEAGLTIVLENEFDAFGWDPAGSDITRRPAALAALCGRIDSPAFGLTFDPANFHCASVRAREQALPVLASYIRYVHVKDVVSVLDPAAPAARGWVRYSDHGLAFDTTRLGAGDVPWPGILADLITNAYPGYLTLEPHCAPAQLLAEMRYAADYLRAALGPYLTADPGRCPP
jgi:sugar phosphate isomerase/epimerase